MDRPHGMLPEAFAAYLAACKDAGVSPDRIVQTIGNAPASAGTHLADGEDNGEPYCAATDLSVRHAPLTQAKQKALAKAMWDRGFVPYVRIPGKDGWNGDPHIHAVYAGCPMKHALREQVHSGLAGKSGLASNGPYTFYQPTAKQKATVRALFLAHNKAVG